MNQKLKGVVMSDAFTKQLSYCLDRKGSGRATHADYCVIWADGHIKELERKLAERDADLAEYEELAQRLVTDTTSRWALDRLIIKALGNREG